MRGPTAADALQTSPSLADVIFRYGGALLAAHRAGDCRGARAPIATTGECAAVVGPAIPRKDYRRIDPATRTFQAIRIWINRELEGLDGFLSAAARRLLAGARLAVITFHSLEDRIVKHLFRALGAADEAVRVLTRKPIVPADAEVARNPRAREREAARD